MKILNNIAGWVLAFICLLASVSILKQSSFSAGLVLILLSVLFVPQIFDRLVLFAGKDKLLNSKARITIKFMVFVCFLFIFGSVAPKESEPVDAESDKIAQQQKPENLEDGIAQAYTVVEAEDVSFPGRHRVTFYIVAPHATTAVDRAVTVIEAAKTLQKETEAKVVSIFLNPHKGLIGYNLAMARYIPDELGMSGDQESDRWEVRASNGAISDEAI